MRVAVLFSGGKDSTYAAYLADKEHELKVLISLNSKNSESYMFHYPSINMVELQAEAMQLPLIFKETEGIKEEELEDLKAAIKEAKEKYKIEGIVSGALYSNYQKDRVDKICEELGLKSIAPLWKKKPRHQWEEMFELRFKIMIVAIGAGGLTHELIGKIVDQKLFEKLLDLNKTCYICTGFEGGEMESLVLDCPLFQRKIKPMYWEDTKTGEFSGYRDIKKAVLVSK